MIRSIPALENMPYVTYIEPHEPQGQAFSLATWNSEDAAILSCCEIGGWLSAAIIAARRKNFDAAFKANAFNWVSLPRVACYR